LGDCCTETRIRETSPDPIGFDWRYAIDATKMNDELDWRPDETFETGIRKTVKWYLANIQNSKNLTSAKF